MGDADFTRRALIDAGAAIRYVDENAEPPAPKLLIHTGNCLEWLAAMPPKSVDHVITDPPYDTKTHDCARQARTKPMRRQDGRVERSRIRRADLGFAALSLDEMDGAAYQFARVARRWVIAFCSIEMVNDWRLALVRHGLEYVRTMIWVKEACTPQFSGDRPAQAFEAICLAHPRGKKRWNSGGKRGLYTHSIVVNRGGKHARHAEDATPKPEPLMLELVDDFTSPGELVIDPFAGMGTTGVACIRRGRAFLGCELKAIKAKRANERLIAEQEGSTINAREAGQLALLGGAR
jgi:site-specific DNA-methyltransferase (adenine-specific)